MVIVLEFLGRIVHFILLNQGGTSPLWGPESYSARAFLTYELGESFVIASQPH